ncbi:uncharacterized protein LOC126410301 [Nymphaea colorata]|uniref:uncharacterized protein LOC126410301 n=1 Tax=Nymphaea colorata TaxID=210225 RepID=UPI00214E93E6|nr:uncharacterized protein LOC126410301 [Nymphaea colorata]
MAASSSSTVNTDQSEIGSYRPENVPVQVTTIRLTKENYVSWSAAMTMGIAGRGRIAYINGRKPELAETSGVWDTWFLEDNQVKTWIVNSVSADIQPLILRKKTARDMWVILEQMYGQKKTTIRTYQLMKTVYGIRQRNLSVADYYGALKAKWEVLDYYYDIKWHCPYDQALHVAKEWENRVFLLLAGLNDEFEGVRSQILNSGEVSSIEDVYSRVEAEEQRRLVTAGGKRNLMSYNERSALVSRGPGRTTRSLRRCTHCKKNGHTVDFCWGLHPEKKGNKGKSSNGKPTVSEETKSSGGKISISAEQLRELRAYLGRIDVNQVEASDEIKASHALAIVGIKDLATGKRIEIGLASDDLYRLPIRVATALVTAISMTEKHREDCLQSFLYWHERLGHLPFGILKQLFPDLCSTLNLSLISCDVCQFAKHVRASYPISTSRVNEAFSLVHSDVWGPSGIHTRQSFQYFITFIDDFSRTTFVYLLKDRSEVPHIIETFILLVQTQYGGTVKPFGRIMPVSICVSQLRSSFEKRGLFTRRPVVILPHKTGWLRERIASSLMSPEPFYFRGIFQSTIGVMQFSLVCISSTACPVVC